MGNIPGNFDDTEHLHGPKSHDVRLAVTEILTVAGVTAYHSSVIVDNREYYFDSMGVMIAPPLWTHLVGQAKRPGNMKTEVIEIGRSPKGGKAMLQFLRPFFERGSYDILYKNCNSFTDCVLYFLTRTRLDSKYTRMERFMMATNPVSTSLMNRIFRSYVESNTGKSCEVDMYVMNPESEGFAISDVIACINELDEASDESDVSVTDVSCFARSNARCCTRETPLCTRDTSPLPMPMNEDQIWR